MTLNRNVVEYNAAADALFRGNGTVDGRADLYGVVTDVCGAPPYYGSRAAPNASRHCPLISDNEEYHYNAAGYSRLAARVAQELRSLLAMGPRLGGADRASAPGARCPDGRTVCPAGASCVKDHYSSTGWGCCLAEGASSCGDGFHCCAQGRACRGNGTDGGRPYSHVCV